MSRLHNPDVDEDGASRGVKKEKYPLDDYLINANPQTAIQSSLLSPISPVSSPETVEVLQSAERLVKSAQKHIMEVSFTSAVNALDENPPSYIGQEPLNESLLYVREIVDSKFQESNDSNAIHSRKPSMGNVLSSNKKLERDRFSVRESSGMLNRPLEISEKNSEFCTNRMAKGMFLRNEKPCFEKAPNWFEIKSAKHINVFPTSTTSNLKSRAKSSCTVPHCMMTNTGVIEINSKDQPNRTIQIQTGPTVDIRGGLTIQNIENIHISPDPSSVPNYNNTATYCFQYEPSASSSLADSNRTYFDKHSSTSSGTRNLHNIGKERHIQSTDYNDMHKILHIKSRQDTDAAVMKDLIDSSQHMNQDTSGTQAILTNGSNNINNNNSNNNSNNDNLVRNELDLRSARNWQLRDSNVAESPNYRKMPISNGNLRTRKISSQLADNVTAGTHLKKVVSINSGPIKNLDYEDFPITDAEVELEDKQEDSEERLLSKGYHKISSNMEAAASYAGQKFQHVQSDKNYVERSQICGKECQTGSCSRKCEKDVEYREKQKLKDALETIANIEKLRFDIKDTGIVPPECTQMCEDKSYCIADAVSFELEPFSEPERFKTALENFCKIRQNVKGSKVDTDSKMFQGAINDFVKMFFDRNSQSDPLAEPYSSVQDLEDKNTVLEQNEQSMEGNVLFKKPVVEKKRQEAAKALKQVKLTPKSKKMGCRQQPIKIVEPKINNTVVNKLSTMKKNDLRSPILQFNSSRPRQPNEYSKPLAPQCSHLPNDEIAQQEEAQSDMFFNEKENSLQNLDLKQPCVSDVDAVLRIYRESMAAICQGTEQLSRLISHYIMKNALCTADQILSPSVPNPNIILDTADVDPCKTGNGKTLVEPVMTLIPHNSKKVLGQSTSAYQENFKDFSSTQTTCSDQIKAIEIMQQKHGQRNISRQKYYPSVSREDAKSSNENNSVCSNETPVSATNKYSSMCSRIALERANTISNDNEKSSPAHCDAANDISNSTLTLKVHKETLVNIRNQSPLERNEIQKSVRKSGGKQFMNVQYYTAEPFEAPIPIAVSTDKKDSPSQSDFKNSLSTYLHFENACGKDMRLPRHSNYDIHSDQTGEFNLYECPVLISGHIDKIDASNMGANDKSTVAENVLETKESELQVIGKILDAVKNSSQFMRRLVLSLFNEIEIDSVNDIIRSLEDAAVHPIVIKQVLVILKERNKGKSLFGENLMLTNSVPALNDWQKTYNEPTALEITSDNMNSFKHSVGFNGNMETTNIRIIKEDKDSATPHLADGMTEGSSPTDPEMNLNLRFSQDSANSINNCNLQGNEAQENKSSSNSVECKMILQKYVAEKEFESSYFNLAIPKTTLESKSCLSEPLLHSGNFEVSASKDEVRKIKDRDCQEAREKSLQTELCQSNDAASKHQSYTNDWSNNPISDGTISNKNDSESNTDKDISFLIPHDTYINNEVADLSSVQKLTSVTLKNEATDEIIGIQIESSCQNCLQLTSFTQEKSTKINSNSDPEQHSIATNKSSGKLKNINIPTLNHTNSTKTLQTDDSNIICHCQKSKNHKDLEIESHSVPCQTSLDALIDLQVQRNFKQLGLIDSEEKPVRRNPEKTTSVNERLSSKRTRPWKLSATSNSHVRKANESNRSGGRKKKSLDQKVKGNQKFSRNNNEVSGKGVKNVEWNDSEKSDSNNVCLLCRRLHGKCSCLDCKNCITNSKSRKVVSAKSKKERERLIKDTSSPHHPASIKHLGHIAGKYSSQKESNPILKELSSRLTTVSPDSKKNVNGKSIHSSPRIVKNNEKSIGTQVEKDAAFMLKKSNLKSNSGISNGNGNKNDGFVNHKSIQIKNNDLLQDAASQSNNSKVDDKSQITRESADITTYKSIETQDTAIPRGITICKSTETQDTAIPCGTTSCKSIETLCKLIRISDKADLVPSRKLNKMKEVAIFVKPPVREAGTLKYFENSLLPQDSSANYINPYCEEIIKTRERLNRCTEVEKFSTMGSQTSGIRNDLEKHQANSSKTTSDGGTVSVLKTMFPNISDEESIIVLQPLKELDHTFFIAKPYCVERKIIQEKLNRNFNVRVKEVTDSKSAPDFYESSYQHQQKTDEEMIHPSDETIEHVNCIDKTTSKNTTQLNRMNSVIDCVNTKECQVDCVSGTRRESTPSNKQSNVAFALEHTTDSNVSFLKNKNDCKDLCTNDDECLRICLQSPSELDNSTIQCKQDCPNEEICLKFCPPIPRVEPSLQTSSININGLLKKFIAENSASNVKLPLAKGVLLELKRLEDSLRAEKEKLGTIYENSESRIDNNKTEMKNVKKLVEGSKPRCNAEGTNRKSVQYEEPHEKLKHIMMNRKSLILPNVVRGLADMHPSTRLERLKIRTADPLVSGIFNKPESDRRYSLFNKSDLGNSSINLNDPRVQTHLASLAQKARGHEAEESSSNSPVDVIPSIPTKIAKKTPMTGKFKNNIVSKINKNSRGMDASCSLADTLNEILIEHDNNSMRSFKSSDLEPGEFLQVRTPFDKATKSCQSNVRVDLEIGELSQDQVKYNSLCNDGGNHSQSVGNAEYTNTQEKSKIQDENIENKYELCMDSAKVIYTKKMNRSNIGKLVNKSESVYPDTRKAIVNGAQQIVDKSDLEFGVSNHLSIHNEAKQLKFNVTDNLQLPIRESNMLKVMEKRNVADDVKSLKRNHNQSSRVAKDLHRNIYENQNTKDSWKYPGQRSNIIEFNSRPQIIDHFLGKTKLEDIRIEYTNNTTDTMSKERQSFGNDCQELYLKSNFISKTTPDVEYSDITESSDFSTTYNAAAHLNFIPRPRNEADLANFDRTASKPWDQTSSDTYSEGEINLPSSCLHSLGEVKISTTSSTTLGKSFKDPDGFTVFVTKSILDSTNAMCTSPGEILAEIQKAETDSSSSIL